MAVEICPPKLASVTSGCGEYPSSFWSQICMLPVRSVTNAYWVFTGDAAGSNSLRDVFRKGRIGPPSTGTSTRSKSVVFDSKAIVRPSGDREGACSLPTVVVRGRMKSVIVSATHR